MNKRYITIFFGIVISLVMAVADTGKLYTSDKLSSSLLTSVCQDSYGYIWVGSEYGLNKFDGYGFTLYHTTQGDTTSIVNNNISTLYPSSNGFLWVGMSKDNDVWCSVQHNGLYVFDINGNIKARPMSPPGTGIVYFDKKMRKLYKAHNLSSLANIDIYGFVYDRIGDLWISTANGIWQYCEKKKTLTSYVHGNGLTTKEYRLGAVVHNTNDMIGFATADGITVFYPSDVNKIGSKLGEVFLTGMTTAGVTADCLASEWTIPYGESTFKMEFSLLDYCNTENITFISSVFKAHFGMSPTEYGKDNQKQ